MGLSSAFFFGNCIIKKKTNNNPKNRDTAGPHEPQSMSVTFLFPPRIQPILLFLWHRSFCGTPWGIETAATFDRVNWQGIYKCTSIASVAPNTFGIVLYPKTESTTGFSLLSAVTFYSEQKKGTKRRRMLPRDPNFPITSSARAVTQK